MLNEGVDLVLDRGDDALGAPVYRGGEVAPGIGARLDALAAMPAGRGPVAEVLLELLLGLFEDAARKERDGMTGTQEIEERPSTISLNLLTPFFQGRPDFVLCSTTEASLALNSSRRLASSGPW